MITLCLYKCMSLTSIKYFNLCNKTISEYSIVTIVTLVKLKHNLIRYLIKSKNKSLFKVDRF